jgi:hypothetical protein
MKVELESRPFHDAAPENMSVCRVGGAPVEGREVALIISGGVRVYMTRETAQVLASALLHTAPIVDKEF